MSVVGVYQIPSPNEQGWRHDLYRHAVASSWMTHEGALSKERDAELNHLLVTSDPAQILSPDVDRWVVLGRSSSEAAAWIQSVLSLNGDECISLTSSVMAAADFLIHRGAEFVDADEDQVQVPLLGDVKRNEVAALYSPNMDVVRRAKKTLAHFEILPTRPNVCAEWDGSLLRVPGADVFGIEAIDLTGRARGLVEGPFLALSPGRWRVDSEWSIADFTSEVALQFSWGPYGDAVNYFEPARRQGRYRVTMDALWSSVAPAMLGVSLMHPCFHGSLTLTNLYLSRVN